MEKYKEIIEKIEQLTVAELAELVKILEEKFGVSAAAVAVAPSGGEGGLGGSQKEEKTTFNVVLKNAGDQKINVIKVVKEITGLGLQEAKSLVDNVPKIIKENVKKEEAEEIKKKLEAVGAKVEFQ